MPTVASRRVEIALVGLALLVAFGLRAWAAPRESPWFDELLTLEPLGAATLSDYLSTVREENSPTQPLYFVVAYGYSRLFGEGVTAMRYLSIALGMASLILAYAIGRRLNGPLCGLIAVMGLAATQIHLEHSLEIRMYMLALVFALLSVYALLLLSERPRPGLLIVHLLWTVALVWTHALTAFLLPVAALWWWVRGPRSRRWQGAWLGGQLLASGSILLWFAQRQQEQIDQQMSWLPMPTLGLPAADAANAGFVSFDTSVVGTWYQWLSSTHYRQGLAALENAAPFFVYCGLILFGAAAVAVRMRSPAREEGDRPLGRDAFVLAWLFAWWMLPALMLYLLSHAWRPVYFPRYVLYSVVPVFLLVGWGVSALPRAWARGAAAGLVAVVALGVGAVNGSTVERPPWQPALAWVDAYSAERLLLYANDRGAIDTARRTVTYLAPAYPGRMQHATDSRAFAERIHANAELERACIVLLGDGPLPALNDYLAGEGLSVEVREFPARFPLTVYRVSGFAGH